MNISGISQFFLNSDYKSGVETKTQVPFSDLLKQAVQNVNDTEKLSNINNIDLLTDNTKNLHNIMIETEKADIALQFTLQLRNKILEAYNEIMRMQV
jgi:flagellar hook-basal body complex protein FliE